MNIEEKNLQHVYVSPSDHPQGYQFIPKGNLVYKFVNSSDRLYFQIFYIFDDGTIVLDEVSQGQITIKSNNEFTVEGDFIRFV
ncbi:hypothetical protein [Streptococcus suis]|uniref:Uncharacterized protein n=1 Tax=Streptococcus suis TaxID=1307 RepID=A0A116R1X1_STRSU|nr:hypothetical protein [Streptococcus suis]AML47538.1 hypothetical protein APQ97_11040 [Streptococcus suis]KPA57091.1 hypothetical protein XK23_06755 [Streptococcus suis]MBL1132402.1 hypothetical protein [Streptococcus suis]MBM6437611.1 hypothetical protein [Streptococcus suis]MCG9872727.1 hypothetical protein [Streptococcus suis]